MPEGIAFQRVLLPSSTLIEIHDEPMDLTVETIVIDPDDEPIEPWSSPPTMSSQRPDHWHHKVVLPLLSSPGDIDDDLNDEDRLLASMLAFVVQIIATSSVPSAFWFVEFKLFIAILWVMGPVSGYIICRFDVRFC